MILKARFVVPVDSTCIENGAIQIDAGRIVAIDRACNLTGGGATDYGDAVIVPGFVNAHTHLELSLLAGRVPPLPDFADWLHRVIAARAADLKSEPGPSAEREVKFAGGGGKGAEGRPSNYVSRAVRHGLIQSVSSGVTALGDITAFPQHSRPVVAASALRAVSFGEVIALGSGRNQLSARLEAAMDCEYQTDRLRIGVSPHSPYTVEPDGLRACVDHAREMGMPLCIHVAETSGEELFTRDAEGPLAEFIRDLGLWDAQIPRSGLSHVQLCHAAGVLGPRSLLAHANYVSDEDIALMVGSGASVVYCPRTHAAFGHAPHRFRDMLRAGINVCLGTDSLASNPTLSILDEVRFLHDKCRDLAPPELLAMSTLRGARALGFDAVTGSLAPGKSADLAIVPLDSGAQAWEHVLASSAVPQAVYLRGQKVYG